MVADMAAAILNRNARTIWLRWLLRQSHRERVERLTVAPSLLRGQTADFREGFEQHRLSGAGSDQMARRHRLPELPVHVERLGHHDDAVAGLAVIQSVRRAAIGVAEGVKIFAV